MLASVWQFIARNWGRANHTSDDPAAPRKAREPFRGRSRPRVARASEPRARKVGDAKPDRVSGPKELRVGAICLGLPTAQNRKPQAPRPIICQGSPRRSPASRHVWLEVRLSSRPAQSAAIVALATRAARSVVEPTTITAAA